jgi:hypothetical protein
MANQTQLPRYLGGAFVAVFATSLAWGLLSMSVLTGSISMVLGNIAGNLARMRASNLLQLLTSVGIVVLACLLYEVLKSENHTLALVALGWWIAEAVVLAVGSLGTFGLIATSVAAATGGSVPPATQALGAVLLAVNENAVTIHMLFFCIGGVLWYWLMFQSRLVPRWLSLWGLIGVVPLLASTLLTLWNPALSLGILPGLPYAPFELVIGIWLIVRGGRAAQHTPVSEPPKTEGN